MSFQDFQAGPWRQSWTLEWNQFSYSKSLCYPNASHQSNLPFGSRCGFKIFKMAAQAAILDSQTERFKQFWISMSLRCLPSSFGSIQLKVWEMSFEEFQDSHHGGHLGYRNWTILAILNLCSDASHQVFAQSDLRFGRGCRLKNFKMAAIAAILDIGTEWFL